MKSSLRLILTALLVLVFSSSLTLAQAVSGSIVGTVTDSSGAAVAGAKVTITEISTGISRNVETNADGGYVMPYLPPGTYKIEVEKQGFKKHLQENIQLSTGSTLRVNAALTVGNITETAEVTSEAPLLQTESADVSQSFEQKRIAELPINGRNFQSLITLIPGVVPSNASVGIFDNPQGTQFLQVNGQNNSANNFQIDGVDNNEPLLGLVVQIPPAEAIQQFSVSTSNYDAEFGRAVGAVVNVTTRPGSNQFHGSLFEFHNNSAFKARNFFNIVRNAQGKLTVPNAIKNQYGGTFGGPIIKNRTFFFGDYQGQNQRIGRTPQIATVPIQAWREGNFTGTTTIYDPNTGAANGSGRTAFQGNQIPTPRISPVAQNILKLLPLPNLPGTTNNYLPPAIPFKLDTQAFDVRVDHQFSDKTNFFVKYNYFQSTMADPAIFGDIGGPTAIGDFNSLANGKGRNQVVTLNGTHAFSPTLTTEARFGFTRYFLDARGPGFDKDLSQQVGISGSNENDPAHKGLAVIDIENFSTFGQSFNMPTINADNIFNWINNWTKVAGSHTLKWGADIRRLRMDRLQIQGISSFGPRGRFEFRPTVTALCTPNASGACVSSQTSLANSFASFLLGAPDRVGRAIFSTTPTNRTTHLFFFGQDTWQVTPRLTVNLGLRYEIYTPITSRLPAGQGNYDPETNNLLVAGVGQVGLSAGVETDWNNFAPRIGLSYRWKDKTVIRGGFGISYFTARFGFTGGTLSTSFPVIADQQIGVTGDFKPEGNFTSIPAFTPIAIPSSGIINPAPNLSLFAVPFKNNLPQVMSYNLTVQRELMQGLSLEVSYVGNKGDNQPFNKRLDASLPGTGTAGIPLNQKFGRTAQTTLRAYGVESYYNSLQVQLEKRLSRGISFGTSYTWSRSTDYTSNNGGLFNPIFLNLNYGPSDFDRTHTLTIHHTLELPFGPGRRWLSKGMAANILGGWQVNGILAAYSGRPFGVTMSNAALNGGPGNNQRPDQLRNPAISGNVGPGTTWFDVTAFANPIPAGATPRYGTAGRNSLRGPGFFNYDFSLFKNFQIREGIRVEFRTEFYNLTNTPKFNQPNGNFSQGSFGAVTSTINNAGEREVQFALRLLF
ncbi:MAG TPA: carboxypeptidase regulatory-like domain-containing protein [Blastocatellia bacterium]|nr:carboxypeptidase regulatory-like domain-containing protein [Blastocatellia bacterium]